MADERKTDEPAPELEGCFRLLNVVGLVVTALAVVAFFVHMLLGYRPNRGPW